ncbi:unnamed protein product [Arabidopsis halleri]
MSRLDCKKMLISKKNEILIDRVGSIFVLAFASLI